MPVFDDIDFKFFFVLSFCFLLSIVFFIFLFIFFFVFYFCKIFIQRVIQTSLGKVVTIAKPKQPALLAKNSMVQLASGFIETWDDPVFYCDAAKRLLSIWKPWIRKAIREDNAPCDVANTLHCRSSPLGSLCEMTKHACEGSKVCTGVGNFFSILALTWKPEWPNMIADAEAFPLGKELTWTTQRLHLGNKSMQF